MVPRTIWTAQKSNGESEIKRNLSSSDFSFVNGFDLFLSWYSDKRCNSESALMNKVMQSLNNIS